MVSFDLKLKMWLPNSGRGSRQIPEFLFHILCRWVRSKTSPQISALTFVVTPSRENSPSFTLEQQRLAPTSVVRHPAVRKRWVLPILGWPSTGWSPWHSESTCRKKPSTESGELNLLWEHLVCIPITYMYILYMCIYGVVFSVNGPPQWYGGGRASGTVYTAYTLYTVYTPYTLYTLSTLSTLPETTPNTTGVESIYTKYALYIHTLYPVYTIYTI